MEKNRDPKNLWLLFLVSDEVREYIERRQEEGKEVGLMDFLEDFTRKCTQERDVKEGEKQ